MDILPHKILRSWIATRWADLLFSYSLAILLFQFLRFHTTLFPCKSDAINPHGILRLYQFLRVSFFLDLLQCFLTSGLHISYSVRPLYLNHNASLIFFTEPPLNLIHKDVPDFPVGDDKAHTAGVFRFFLPVSRQITGQIQDAP